MLIKELLDEWEPEAFDAPWRKVKVKPVDSSDGWLPYADTASMFDDAFGISQWGIDRVPTRNTFDPVVVSIRPTAKIRYDALRDNGFKIVFMEDSQSANFGFHPSMKQFWFKINDPDLFFTAQQQFERNNDFIPTQHPNNRFIERYLNDAVLKHRHSQQGHTASHKATLLMYGALRGNEPVSSSMVFMFDPSKYSVDITQLKKIGLIPDFFAGLTQR